MNEKTAKRADMDRTLRDRSHLDKNQTKVKKGKRGINVGLARSTLEHAL